MHLVSICLRSARLVSVTAILVLGLVTSQLSAPHASAGLGTCSSCPGVSKSITLLDGTSVNASISVQDAI